MNVAVDVGNSPPSWYISSSVELMVLKKVQIGLYWSSVIDSKQEQSLSLLRRSGINSPLESEFFFLVCMGIQPIHFTSEGVKRSTLDLEIS